MQDCQVPLIDLTVGHYNSTGMHNTSLRLAFPISIQQGRALECASVAFYSTNMHFYARPNRKSPKYGRLYISDTQHGPYGICIRRVPLYHVTGAKISTKQQELKGGMRLGKTTVHVMRTPQSIQE